MEHPGSFPLPLHRHFNSRRAAPGQKLALIPINWSAFLWWDYGRLGLNNLQDREDEEVVVVVVQAWDSDKRCRSPESAWRGIQIPSIATVAIDSMDCAVFTGSVQVSHLQFEVLRFRSRRLIDHTLAPMKFSCP